MKKTIVTKAILLSLLVTLLGVGNPVLKVNNTQAYTFPNFNLVQPKSDLELCLEAKGWLGTPTKFMLSPVSTYCADYPSILSMTKRPSLDACEMVSGSMKFNNDENILLYREVCTLLYPEDFSPIGTEEPEVDMCEEFKFSSDSDAFTSFGNDTDVNVMDVELKNISETSILVDELNFGLSGIYFGNIITGARLVDTEGNTIKEGFVSTTYHSIEFDDLGMTLDSGVSTDWDLLVDTGASAEFHGMTVTFTLDESVLVNLETADEAVCEGDLSNTIAIGSIDA